MSIQLLIGRAGTGKTTKYISDISNKLVEDRNGAPIIFIVPEQMSFIMEYKLVSSKDVNGMIRCQVYSFSRLAWLLLQETGYLNRTFLDSVGVSMLIQRIVEENSHQLHLFDKAAKKQGFIKQVETMIKEFKRYCIEPSALKVEIEDVILKEKMLDMQFIFEKFQEEVIGNYLLTEDYLHLLINEVKNSSYIKEATIYVDGFFDLTTLEYLLMEQLMIYAKEMHISFTLDQVFEHALPNDMHLFRKSGEYLYELCQICIKNQLTYQVEKLTSTVRYKDKAIAHLEENFSNYPIQKYVGEMNIKLIQAANKRAEMEEIAREIIRLVQQQGYQYKDIAVLYRDQAEYGPYIATIFDDYQIPVHIDMKKTMQNHPFIEMIRSLLAILDSNFQYEAVFRYLKTGLINPYFDEKIQENHYFSLVDKVENYCLEFGIRGNRFLNEWKYKSIRTPEEASSEVKDRNKKIDCEVETFRKQFVDPILEWKQVFTNKKTGLEICQKLFELLEDLRIAETLGFWKYEAEKKGLLENASMHEQAWNKVVELLEQFVEILGGEVVSLEEFVSIIDAGLEAMELALLPQAIDQVAVANLEQSRIYDVKVAFVVGVTDSTLPLKRNNKEILTDEERQKLKDTGIKLAPAGTIKLLDEEFIAYRAFTTASERLYISYPIADEEGKAILPSMYIKKIKTLLPGLPIKHVIVDPLDLEEEEQKEYILHPERTLPYLIGQLGKKEKEEIAPIWHDLTYFYQNNERYGYKVNRLLESLNYENRAIPLEDDLATNLFTTKQLELIASVSRMERFNSCHFSHFAHYGLNLKPRKIYKLENFDIGDMFHEGLQLLNEQIKAKTITWKDLTKEACICKAEEIVAQIGKDKKKIIFAEEKHSYLRYKLAATLAATIYRIAEHGAKSDFEPVHLEYEFGKSSESPITNIGEQVSMKITGKIDRVDEVNLGDKVYVRIIDYKSSQHDIDLSDVWNGLQLQIVTYLDRYLDMAKEQKSPAGMLYFHVHHPFITGKKALDEEKIEEELQKKYKMKGIVLDNLNVIHAMDKELDKNSSIIPVGIKKDGTFTQNSKVLAEEDFNTLRKFVNKKFQQSGEKIISGDIAINPYKVNGKVPCTFCDFKSVCQFDETLKGNSYRYLPKLPQDLVLKEMEKWTNEQVTE